MNTIFQKLSKVQESLAVPKGQKNTFGNYNYRSCEDILEKAKPLCIQNGLLLLITDEIKQLGDRYYVSATATVVDIDTGEKTSTVAYARESLTKKGQDESQITGSASSYARKYALNGLFAIDDNKDADATNTHGKDAPKELPKQQPKGIDKLKQKELTDLAKDAGVPIEDIEHGWGVKIEQLTYEQWLKSISNLEKRLKGA